MKRLIAAAAHATLLSLLLAPRSAGATQCQPPTVDWSDFPTGYQCIVGVQKFAKAKWGAVIPATGGHPTKDGCAELGACIEWVYDLPDGNVWNRHPWGSTEPQAYDILIYPPTSTNEYGHAAVLDHMEGSTQWVMDDNWDGNENRSCLWDGHDGWVHSTTRTPYGFYRLKTLEPPPPDKLPEGYIDGADCQTVRGWAYDPDDAGAKLAVHLSFDGDGGGAPTLDVSAGQHRDDLCSAIGSCEHGFSLATPIGLMDGKPHQVFAHADGASGKPGSALKGSPASFTCAPPKAPFSPAVKRHIVAPASLASWKLSMLTQVARFEQPDSDAIKTGDDAPGSPKLVQADDGSPEVWLVDGKTKRHVVSAESMSAWQFDGAPIVKTPAKDVTALDKGPDWPSSPFAFVDPKGAVYLLDVPPPAPPMTGTGGSAGASGSGGASGKAGSAGASGKAGSGGSSSAGGQGGSGGSGGSSGKQPIPSGGGSGGADGAPSTAADGSTMTVSVSSADEVSSCSHAGGRGGRSLPLGTAAVAAAVALVTRRRGQGWPGRKGG